MPRMLPITEAVPAEVPRTDTESRAWGITLTMRPSVVRQAIGRNPTGRGCPSESNAVSPSEVVNPLRRQIASGTTLTEKTSRRTTSASEAT